MKKILIILFITIALTGLLFPAVSHAWDLVSIAKESVIDAIYSLMDVIGNASLSFNSWILWLCGIAFNFSIVQFVVHMKDRIDNIPAIYAVWQTVRDLANMFFIFILLAIAIQTILQMGDYKKMLKNVILAALFINFSFFFTSVMIDASNLLALQFYNGFAGENCNSNTTSSEKLNAINAAANKLDGCMSQKIVSALKLGTLYSIPDADGNAVTKTSLSSKGNPGQWLVTVTMGQTLMLVTAGIFLASAILIVFRFIQLIIILMFSPLAFASLALPAMKDYAWNPWWKKLKAQLIFAPVYFMFLWVTMKIIQSSTSKQLDGLDWQRGFNGNPQTMWTLLASYIVIISMLIYSLTLAKELGAKGSDTAAKWSKGFQGLVGRNTVGRMSSRIANSQLMQGMVAKSPSMGRLVQKGFDYGAKQSFGDKKGGFDQAEKDAIKNKTAQAQRFGASPLMKARVDARVKQTAEEHGEAISAHNAALAEASAKFGGKEQEYVGQETILDGKFDLAKIKIRQAEEKSKASTSAEDKTAADKEIADAKDELVKLEKQKQELAENKQKLVEDKNDSIKETKTRLENAETAKLEAESHKNMIEGLAAKRKEQYAKSNEKAFYDVGEDIYSLGSNITGFKGKLARLAAKTAGGMLNTVTGHTSRVAQSAAIRKEKTKKEKALEAALEAAKEDMYESNKEEEEDKKKEGGGGEKDKQSDEKGKEEKK